MTTPQHLVSEIAQSAGITVNGQNPYDIRVTNPNFYSRVIHQGALGLGESYMEKWWECEKLDVLFEKILRNKLDDKVSVPLHFKLKLLMAYIINYQSKTRAKEVAHSHYDIGNDLFAAMLDKRMIYSCGYWKNAQTLDQAQEAKLELICQKLQLQPGMTLLDIGCGWGGLAKYAAEKFGVSVVGVTISQPQYEYAQKICKGLPIEIRLQDYRDIYGKFDRIVSVGMFEHVGHLNYQKFMKIAYDCLANEGLFLLHTIGVNEHTTHANEWITKYIFPNGMLPSVAQIGKATEKMLILEDWQNLGVNYSNTLLAWHHNFVSHWDELKTKYDEKFFRMWTYYLLSCAGSFRARYIQLWQAVFSKGYSGVYIAPR